MNFRCSALPRIFTCPASSKAPEILIDSSSPEAVMGTAVHEAMKYIVENNGGRFPDVTAIGHRHKVDDLDTFNYLCWSGWNMWKKLQPFIDEPKCEVQMSQGPKDDPVLTGTADIIGKTPDGDLVILDWKTGHVQADAYHQLMGYLWLATYGTGIPENSKIITVWVRSGDYEVTDVSKKDLIDWGFEFSDLVLGKDTYNPGQACTYCPLANECPARSQLVKATMSDFLDINFDHRLETTTPEDLALLKPKVDLLSKAIDRYKAVLRSKVQEVGAISLGDGREIRLQEENRQTVKLADCWGYLCHVLGVKDADGLFKKLGSKLKISKSAILDLATEDAIKGTKARIKREILEELGRQGGLITSTIQKLVTGKIPTEKGKK